MGFIFRAKYLEKGRRWGLGYNGARIGNGVRGVAYEVDIRTVEYPVHHYFPCDSGHFVPLRPCADRNHMEI